MTDASHCGKQISTDISGQKKSEVMKGADIVGLAAVSDAAATSEMRAMSKEIKTVKSTKTLRDHPQATTVDIPEEVEIPFLRNPLNDPNDYYKAGESLLFVMSHVFQLSSLLVSTADDFPISCRRDSSRCHFSIRYSTSCC